MPTEGFFPKLPIIVPTTQGIAFWWDIVGWVFQIVIMVTIIWLVTRWALNVEKEIGERATARKSSSNSSARRNPGS